MRIVDIDVLRDEVLHDNTYDNDTVNYYLGMIDDTPTIEPVKRGEWKRPFLSGTNILNPSCFCSNCAQSVRPSKRTNFCPNCGADMRTDIPESYQEK